MYSAASRLITLLTGCCRRAGFWPAAVTVCAAGLSTAGLFTGCNPFAPGLDHNIIDRNTLLGNRHSVDGMFRYFRNTYEMRDTSLYGKLLARDFRFQFYNYDRLTNEYWDRDQEMRITYNMFTKVKQVSLIWSSYYNVDTLGNDTLSRVERNFNLTIIQDESVVYRGTGRANLTLARPDARSEWRIKYWIDNSDR